MLSGRGAYSRLCGAGLLLFAVWLAACSFFPFLAGEVAWTTATGEDDFLIQVDGSDYPR